MYEYFYHSITKKAVIAFGSLFNDIYVARYNADGSEKERIKVPIAYMTKQKFISRLNQNPTLQNDFYMSLPRMAFEFSSLIYDSSRKNDTFQKSFSYTDNIYSYRFGRVPYNLTFTLHAFTKNTEDCLQILEQILPWFTPEYSVTVKMVNPTDMSVDVPFVIQNVIYDEDVEDSDFENRKTVSMSVEFACKLFYYGPTKSLPLGTTGASGASGFAPGVVIPEGMVGKVIVPFYTTDGDFSFQTLETGITGNASPTGFSPTASDQSYLIYGNRIFS